MLLRQSLLDDIINSINELSYVGVDNIESSFLSQPPASLGFTASATQSAEEKHKYEVENGTHQLETLLGDAIDKNFDIMEIFALRNMLAVPDDVRDWVRLRHYDGVNLEIKADAPTEESVKKLRLKARESQRLNRLLLAESNKTAKLIEQLRASKGELPSVKIEREGDSSKTPSPFAFLGQRGELADGSASAPISTTTAFALSQLPALRQLLATLQPQMKQLAERKKADPNLARDESGTEQEKSERRKRVEYIESQTRRHLEQVAGLELGKMGEVVDGEWQGTGRQLNRGEVEDLERIAAMVSSKGVAQDDKMDES